MQIKVLQKFLNDDIIYIDMKKHVDKESSTQKNVTENMRRGCKRITWSWAWSSLLSGGAERQFLR